MALSLIKTRGQSVYTWMIWGQSGCFWRRPASIEGRVYRHVTMPLIFALASGQYDRVGLSTHTKQDSLLPSDESFLGPCSTDENIFPSNFPISWSAQSTIYRQHKQGHFFTERNLPGTRLVILFRRHIPQIASNAARSLATGPCTPQVSDPSKFNNLFVFVSSQQKKCRGRSV